MNSIRKTLGGALLLTLLMVLSVGCDSDTESVEAVYYYQHAKPILDSKCNTCHVTGGVAPFTFASYDDAYALREAIAVEVKRGTMPPWLGDEACNDYTGSGALTAAEKKTLTDWVDQGGPEGDPLEEGAPVHNPATEVKLSRSDVTLSMKNAYTPVDSPDDYRCFLLDWEAGENEGYVTGFRARPGNPGIVHHVIAFLVAPDQVGTIEEKDAADEGDGYQCFGGPGSRGAFQWLGAWAPGGQGADFPEGTGIQLQKGARIVLQVHYNVLDNAPQPDKTSIELRLDSEVEHPASILLWLNFQWFVGDNMLIPAGQKSVTHSYAANPGFYLGALTGGLFGPGESFRIHWASLHMHELGVQTRLWVESEGAETCLLDIPRWDFNWQRAYGFREPVVFNPGDKLHMSCTWDNSAENQHRIDGQAVEPRNVAWGDGTQDEMCLGILYISKL